MTSTPDLAEDGFDLADKGLFGTALLPRRSLKRRELAAGAGRVMFVAIALVAGLILVTLLNRIVSEAYVPEQEIEVEGIRLPTKTVASTQFAWKVETWNPLWDANDLRLERENVTLVASWEETQFEAIDRSGAVWTSPSGQASWDLEEDVERALCAAGSARTTYKPLESFSLGGLFGDRSFVDHNPASGSRLVVFMRDTAPTPGMGDYWWDTDDAMGYVWHGLRWEAADDDPFLQAAVAEYLDQPNAFSDGKVWLHYTPEAPLFKGNGDLWFNRTIVDGNVGEVLGASVYNQSSRTWDALPLADLDDALVHPASAIDPFEPEFCTKAEATGYILNQGLTGSYSAVDVKHEDGFHPHQTSAEPNEATMTVSLTSGGERSTFVELTSDGFSLDHLELRPSPTSSVNWLFIEHRFNWTVTITQTEGPAADARESSYLEVGDLSLGSGGSLFRSRLSFLDAGMTDLDGDGLIDACDEDIDGDGDDNPVLGDAEACPTEGRYATEDGSVLTWDAWVAANDANEDGIHDDVADRDIDGDGIANLVDGQGEPLSAASLFAEAGGSVASLSEVPVLNDLVSPLLDKTCAEAYKRNDPAFAVADCQTATALIEAEGSALYADGLDADEFCIAVRQLEQHVWFDHCGAPDRLEAGIDAYDERAPVVPLLMVFSLGAMWMVMRRPGKVLLFLRGMLLRVGTNEPETQGLSPWAVGSLLKEGSGRVLSLIVRIALFALGLRIFLVTFSTDLALIRPFSFVIGGAMALLGGIAVMTAGSTLLSLRPDRSTPPAEGLVDVLVLTMQVVAWVLAVRWVLVEGWIVPAVSLLMVTSAVRRLAVGALQLTRTTRIQEDRLSLVVQGRDGWMLTALVVLIVGLATVPIAFNLPFVFADFPSSEPYKAGLRAAFWGSVYVVGYTMLFAIPLSIGAAIWLEEYAPNNRFRRTIQALITNLAGVPAIVFGLFGLAMFLTSRGAGLGLGATVLTAGMTMATMAMPTIVISSQEALRAVPPSLRNAAFGLGCTKWQVTQDHVLPHALPGMMTGTILAMSRIMGEAAPLILVGAVASVFSEPDAMFYVSYQAVPSLDAWFAWIPGVESHVANMPLFADRGWLSADPAQFTGPDSNDRGRYTVLPVQVYVWTGLPQVGYQVIAAAASIVLLATLVIVNSTAILLRAHFRRYSKT